MRLRKKAKRSLLVLGIVVTIVGLIVQAWFTSDTGERRLADGLLVLAGACASLTGLVFIGFAFISFRSRDDQQ